MCVIKFKLLLPAKISLGIITLAFCFCSSAQNTSNTAIWSKLIFIENDTSFSIEEKLPLVFDLKKQFEDLKLIKDSVYARILHRIGFYEYKLNNEVATKNAIVFTHTAIRINSSGKKDNAPSFCVNSYTNLAVYYKSLGLYQVAVQYYDSAISYRRKFDFLGIYEVQLLLDKSEMLHAMGDFQKAVEEMNIAISKAGVDKDSSRLHDLLNQRAQSYLMQGQLEAALRDVNLAGDILKQFAMSPEAINNLMIKARILARKKDTTNALSLFNKAIKQRLQTNDYSQIARDYTDFGNFYLDELQNYSKAKDCYLKTIRFASKANDQETLAKAQSNLEYCSFKQRNYRDAEHYSMEAMKTLKITGANKILVNPTAIQLSSIGNKELIFAILGNKSVLLLERFKLTGNKNYLSACLQTALLTDTFITKMRHEQVGEQSKLYWRNRTREFFVCAMEATYLANDARLAFYFMEKSRAVLLNDNLNELGAAAHLPSSEAIKERGLKIAVVTELQKLSSLSSNEMGYEEQQAKLAVAKGALEHYIKSLEKKYPAYYQYKYADEVPSLNDLQKKLSQNKQSFVHYFIGDTVAYILGIAPSYKKLMKLSKDDFNTSMFINFLKSCTEEPVTQNQYASFASQSYLLYKLLFQPMNIPKGKVVICPDNFLIPFEALCTDNTGNHFLVTDYSFIYVYSARYLLTQYNIYQAKGDFIGFAPVSFKSFANIVDLKQSGDALKQSAQHYNNIKVLTNGKATRENFISTVSNYTIVNVFSHARADTTEKEPVLYMNDSLIYLSELQLLHKPSTKLVVLSACQTNIGRNAKGEGIFSLARGFSSAGIPSVAATLWKADEHAIYAVSEKFHEYLSQGMSKDEALQKAKLYFIENGDYEKPFPYYWANMIIIGNDESIELSENYSIWWRITAILFISAIVLLTTIYLLKKRSA